MAPAEPDQTVLVVEDDEAVRAWYGAVLSEHGYRVGLAVNGHEALDYLRDRPATDLILLDMLTPGMDGWQFLKKWRQRWASVPVLIATAIGVASKEWAASLGAVGILRKPIGDDVLLENVKKCLREREAG
jgi:CheY-like chemotaxis protein